MGWELTPETLGHDGWQWNNLKMHGGRLMWWVQDSRSVWVEGWEPVSRCRAEEVTVMLNRLHGMLTTRLHRNLCSRAGGPFAPDLVCLACQGGTLHSLLHLLAPMLLPCILQVLCLQTKGLQSAACSPAPRHPQC